MKCFDSLLVPSSGKLNKWQFLHWKSLAPKFNGRLSFRFSCLESTVPSAAPVDLSAFTPDYSTVILSWDPVPKGDVNGELLGYAVVVNGSDNFLFAAPCFSSLELGNINFSSDTCIRMAAVTKVGFGPMTDCAQIDFGRFSFCPFSAIAGVAITIFGEPFSGYYIPIRNINHIKS